MVSSVILIAIIRRAWWWAGVWAKYSRASAAHGGGPKRFVRQGVGLRTEPQSLPLRIIGYVPGKDGVARGGLALANATALSRANLSPPRAYEYQDASRSAITPVHSLIKGVFQ